MVPGALRISPARPATSTFGAGYPGGASVVRPAAALAGGEHGHWCVRSRNWYVFLLASSSAAVHVLDVESAVM